MISSQLVPQFKNLSLQTPFDSIAHYLPRPLAHLTTLYFVPENEAAQHLQTTLTTLQELVEVSHLVIPGATPSHLTTITKLFCETFKVRDRLTLKALSCEVARQLKTCDDIYDHTKFQAFDLLNECAGMIFSATCKLVRATLSIEEKEVQTALTKAACATLTEVNRVYFSARDVDGIWYAPELDEHLGKGGEELYSEQWMGYADPDYFSVDKMTFTLKQGAASDAIDAFFLGQTIADCGSVTAACYYKAMLDLFGREKFDLVFGIDSPFKLTISGNGINHGAIDTILARNTLDAIKRTQGTVGNRPVQVGEECHFRGVKWYKDKHPMGVWAGDNVICVGYNHNGEQLFLGFGFEKPLTELEIYDRLIDGYNQERSEKELRYISSRKSDRARYDKALNPHLREHYTIEKPKPGTISPHIRGYFSSSPRALIISNIFKLLKGDIGMDLRALTKTYP